MDFAGLGLDCFEATLRGQKRSHSERKHDDLKLPQQFYLYSFDVGRRASGNKPCSLASSTVWALATLSKLGRFDAAEKAGQWQREPAGNWNANELCVWELSEVAVCAPACLPLSACGSWRQVCTLKPTPEVLALATDYRAGSVRRCFRMHEDVCDAAA